MTNIDEQARAVFLAALERAPDQWPAFLDENCGANAELRALVEQLLRSHRDMGSIHVGAGEPRATIDAPLPEVPGAVIGPYKLIEQIGEGGMGTVWMAQQSEPVKRLVALKLIKPGMDSMQVLARFNAERQALALMDHPNIAKVFDAGTTETGRPFFVMELVKGVPLTKYCDEHRLTPKQRLELFIPVCQAVQHAHQKGIIHRDLKPSNVLVAPYDGRPVVKVIDFGVAKATGERLTDKTLCTELGAVVGTLEYMSPEQAELNNHDIDTRSDIYSLGVLLYELLTGTTPLDRKRLKEAAYAELLRIIREEEPQKPSTRLSNSTESLPSVSAQRQLEPAKLTRLLRGELDWIVMKALEKDRNRRYDSANGFAADVQRYLANEPVVAAPPSPWYRFRKFARRNRAGMLLTAVALALIVVTGAGLWSWHYQETLRRAEQNFHAELTRGSVESSLRQLPDLHRRALWLHAENLLEQAEQQLGPEGESALRARVAQSRRDTAFLKRVDAIRLKKSEIVDSKLNNAAALADYPGAFVENGFDVLRGDPAELAARLKQSAVRDYLLAALDDWAMTVKADANDSQRILAITAAATGQAWRSELNGIWEDADRLAELYQAIPERERTPAIIIAVAQRLIALGRDGIPRLEQGLRQYPDDFWLHFNLGLVLTKDRPEAAVGAYRAALAIRPGTPSVHNNLGAALSSNKEYDAAIAEYREAIRLDPNYATPHCNLGKRLDDKKDYDAAIAEYREAIRLDPNYALPHNNLGNVLSTKKEYDAAIAEYREAIRLDPKLAVPHINLGNVLSTKKEYDAAIAEFQEAIRLDAKYAVLHIELGNALCTKKEYDAAMAEYREAILLDPKYAVPHYNLGKVLQMKKEYEAASAAYQEAIRLDPNYAEANCNLAEVYRVQGRFAEAVKFLRRGHEFGSRRADWPYPSALWLKRAEQLLALDNQLAKVLTGEVEPAGVAEQLELARFCQTHKKQYVAAARFYAGAFATEPRLADDLRNQDRYNAACVAALAGCGQGKDADKLDAKERARLRRQALDWLRYDLEAAGRLLDNGPDMADTAARIAKTLQHWLVDPDFAGVRGPERVAKLPEAEQQAWRKLWADVEAMLARAQPMTKPE